MKWKPTVSIERAQRDTNGDGSNIVLRVEETAAVVADGNSSVVSLVVELVVDTFTAEWIAALEGFWLLRDGDEDEWIGDDHCDQRQNEAEENADETVKWFLPLLCVPLQSYTLVELNSEGTLHRAEYECLELHN